MATIYKNENNLQKIKFNIILHIGYLTSVNLASVFLASVLFSSAFDHQNLYSIYIYFTSQHNNKILQ